MSSILSEEKSSGFEHIHPYVRAEALRQAASLFLATVSFGISAIYLDVLLVIRQSVQSETPWSGYLSDAVLLLRTGSGNYQDLVGWNLISSLKANRKCALY